MILNYEKIKKRNKQQAASLTMDLGYCKIVLMCSFGDFPHDKFVKSPLGQVVMTSESWSW